MKISIRQFLMVLAVALLTGCVTSGSLEKYQAETDAKLAAKADQVAVNALATRVDTAETNAKAAMASVGKVITTQVAVTEALDRLARSAESTNSRLAGLEKKVVRVSAMENQVVGRLGAMEDSVGIGHEKQLIQVYGFPSATLNDKDELATCAEISKGMQARIGEIKKVLEKGWVVKEIAGFADERPFKKGGKIVAKSDELNAECAQKRAEAIAEAFGVDADLAKGRGATTKFGNRNTNRSALIYFERAPAAAAPAKP